MPKFTSNNNFSEKSTAFEKQALDTIDYAEDKATDTVSKTADNAKARVHMLSDAYRVVADASRKVQDWASHAGETVIDSKVEVENRIKSRPLTSSAVAFGVGLIAAKLFLGRKSNRD